jgi:HSP20 family protein
MTVRELLHIGNSPVPVTRGASPIAALQDEMNSLFSNFFGDVSLPVWLRNRESAFAVSPAMDVSENDKEYKLTAELPGIDAKDVSVSVADGYITLRGEKKEEKKEEREGYSRQERSYGSFQRVVPLPENANFDKAEASFKNGVLTLCVPKKAGAQSKERKLEIKQAA